MKKLCMLFVAVLFLTGIAAHAFGGSSANNNFTMLDGTVGDPVTGGTNDVVFTWDGTRKSSVAASGQVSNAAFSSITPFFGVNWTAHDAAIYGPGTYTVYAECPAGSPGCGAGPPITFTVATGQIAAHILFDWGGSNDLDVVNVWVPNAVFGPSPLFTGPDGGTADPATVWSFMSSDWDGDGINGYEMVDGPFLGFSANFNVTVPAVTVNNNFTMIAPDGGLTGGCNGIAFTWDGTRKTVVQCPQISNATLASSCPFFGVNWTAHDVAIYGPGTYTVYDGCPAGCPSCGTGNAITFTVGAGKLGVHMLFDWGGNNDMDVVDVWTPNAVFGPSPLYTGPDGGTIDPAKVWDWMSSDWNNDGINGYPMTDGPFVGFNANFNVMSPYCVGCANCDDNNACTIDTCDCSSGCIHTPIICNDNNACTVDTCNPATGCVFTPVKCPLGYICSPTTGACVNPDPCAGVNCNDNNACTIDSCNTTTGVCVHTAITCNDNNACTTDTCNPATGCVFTLRNCDDGNFCTTDSCNTANGSCVNTYNASVCPIFTSNNNFTMVDPTGKTIGGTNDVRFYWDATRKTSVAASGQIPNAVLASSCPFQGSGWFAHDLAIYGPGTYTVYAGCAPGSPGCGSGTPITFTVGAGQLGGHMLFDWGTSTKNVDVVDVWTPVAVFAPSALFTGACGSQVPTRVWDWMSSDWNGDGKNGYPMVDGPFLNFNANFNITAACVGACVPADCNDNNACTNDVCTCSGCVHTLIDCNDNNACTVDSCNTATGCVHTPIASCCTANGQCNDNNECTVDSCNLTTHQCVHTTVLDGTGCIDNCPVYANCQIGGGICLEGRCVCNPPCCDDNNPCTDDRMDPYVGCVFTPKNCNDNNACTIDTCNTANGLCVHTQISCDDNNACTTDTCDSISGCVHYPMACNDNNACTADSCNPVTGCVFTPISCNDNNACTNDSCNPVTGCVYTSRICNDNNLCTTDTCDPATGCVFTPLPIVSDNNPCTNDSCDPATGLPVYTPNTAPCDDGLFCNGTDTCSGGTCSVHSGNPCFVNGMTCDETTRTCIEQMSVTIRGGGQKPNGADLQIQTKFTVINGNILSYTDSSVTVSVGSTVSVDWHQGTGPNPTSVTWNGASIPMDTPLSIVCPTAGQTGKLVLTNTAALGGKDTDRITINCQ